MREGWRNRIAAFLTAVTVSGHEAPDLSVDKKTEPAKTEVVKKAFTSALPSESREEPMRETATSSVGGELSDSVQETDTYINELAKKLAKVLPNLLVQPTDGAPQDFYESLSVGDYFLQDDSSGEIDLSYLRNVDPDGKTVSAKYDVIRLASIVRAENGTYKVAAIREVTGDNDRTILDQNGVFAENVSEQNLPAAVSEAKEWKTALVGGQLKERSREEMLSYLDQRIRVLKELRNKNWNYLQVSDEVKKMLDRTIGNEQDLYGHILEDSPPKIH